MKIAHVISGLTKGGGEKVAVELANTAVQHGDEVTMILGWPEDPAFLQDQLRPDVKIIFVSKNKKHVYLKMIPWLFKNKKLLEGQDILHCHLTYGTFFGSSAKLIIRSLRKNVKPLIVETNHAVGMLVPAFARWRSARLASMRDGYVLMAKDNYWNNFLEKRPKLPAAIIPNGIAPFPGERSEAGRRQLFEQLNIPAGVQYLVGTVGMLRPDRQPELYIPIFKQIHTTLGEAVHFIMVGAGSEMEKIQALIQAEGLSSKVSLPGLVNRPAEIVQQLDVYVSLSVGETAGISMIEAAMCRLPVVAIQLTPGYVMKPEDWVWSDTDLAKVAEKIIHLLTDAVAAKELSGKQYAFVNMHYTAEAMYRAYHDFYKKVLNSRP
jgi:glycosyltransferase involved in cell wall biosynthesis